MSELTTNPSRHVSYEQVKIIIDFMGQHVDFATGSLRTLEARQTSKSLWNELTKLLNNSRSGTKKTSDGWSKYWSDFKNKLKNKVSILKKKKRFGSAPKKNMKPLTRLEKRALVILGPHFEKKISKVSIDPFNSVSNCLPEVKLEAFQENGHHGNTPSESSDKQSDETDSDDSEEFDDNSDEHSNGTMISSIYPKWLIEIEKKRAESDLTRAKAEEQRANIAAKNSETALVQAEALRKLADAAVIQAEALAKIASIMENTTQRHDVMPI